METGIAREELRAAVTCAANAIVSKVKEGSFTAPDLAALLKLLQIDKETQEESVKHVTAQWIEPWESKSSNDE